GDGSGGSERRQWQYPDPHGSPGQTRPVSLREHRSGATASAACSCVETSHIPLIAATLATWVGSGLRSTATLPLRFSGGSETRAPRRAAAKQEGFSIRVPCPQDVQPSDRILDTTAYLITLLRIDLEFEPLSQARVVDGQHAQRLAHDQDGLSGSQVLQ